MFYLDYMRNIIERFISKGIEIPYPEVPCDSTEYLQVNSAFRVYRKYLHKYFRLLIAGQLGLLRPTVDHKEKILWLYTGKTTLGDANLELSGRALLKNRGISVSVLLTPQTYPLFQEDDIFENVFKDIRDLNTSDYSHIVLTEFNYKSIALKNRFFTHTPMTCLFEYFDGPRRNQCLFSFFAVNDRFGLGLSTQEVLRVARPYVARTTITPQVFLPIASSPYLAIGVGGIDPGRTYLGWSKLLQLLDQSINSTYTVIILGSADATPHAEEIISQVFKHIRIVNYVGRTSILEAFTLLQDARIYLGCDGGLLHVAHAAGCPTISIFREGEPSRFFLTPACDSIPFDAGADANNVHPQTLLPALLSRIGL